MCAELGIRSHNSRATRHARASSRSSPSMVSMSRTPGSPKCFRFRPKARAPPLARRAARSMCTVLGEEPFKTAAAKDDTHVDRTYLPLVDPATVGAARTGAVGQPGIGVNGIAVHGPPLTRMLARCCPRRLVAVLSDHNPRPPRDWWNLVWAALGNPCASGLRSFCRCSPAWQ